MMRSGSHNAPLSMNRAIHTAILWSLLLVPSALGSYVVARWTHLEIVAHLNPDSTIQVTETHDISVRGDVSTLDRQVGFGPGQRVRFQGIWRITDDGSLQPLTPGDAAQPSRYQAFDETGVLHWSMLEGTATPTGDGFVRRRYRIVYDLAGAVVPAWDLPAGPAPLDILRSSWGSPRVRLREALAAWREASPAPDRRYRLDQDVLLPSRDGPSYPMDGANYYLEWGELAWRRLDPEEPLGKSTPGGDYRVRHLLEYLPAGRPDGVDFVEAAIRTGSPAALPVFGLVLWLIFVIAEARRRPHVDRAFFEANVLASPPEVLGAMLWRNPDPPSFAALVTRLANEQKVRVEILEAGVGDQPSKTRFSLRVDRASLRPWEKAVVDRVFGKSSEVTSDELQGRHRQGILDLDQITADEYARALPEPARPSRRWLPWLLALALGLAGMFLLAWDLKHYARAEPFALAVGTLAAVMIPAAIPTEGWLGYSLATTPWLLLPLAVFTVANGAFVLLPNAPFSGAASAGLALSFLCAYQRFLANTPRLEGEIGRRVEALWWSRGWARRELHRRDPDLRDEWVPSLRALKLSRALERWQRRFRGAPSSGEIQYRPKFTGNSPESDLPDNWATGLRPRDESLPG
jgi:hypothetical protein